MGVFDTLREKIDVYRLEKRHMRRSKRTTFVSTARYVDGEYVYTGSRLTLRSDDSSAGSGWMEEPPPGERVKRIFKRQSALF